MATHNNAALFRGFFGGPPISTGSYTSENAQAAIWQGRADAVVGVWTLMNYVNEWEGSAATFPLGAEPQGFLIYTGDGYVSAQLMRPGRSPFRSPDWATASEYQEVGSSYIRCCSVYEVNEENQTVTHIPTVALLPNLINGKQFRSVQLRGDRLTLRTHIVCRQWAIHN